MSSSKGETIESVNSIDAGMVMEGRSHFEFQEDLSFFKSDFYKLVIYSSWLPTVIHVRLTRWWWLGVHEHMKMLRLSKKEKHVGHYSAFFYSQKTISADNSASSQFKRRSEWITIQESCTAGVCEKANA